MKYALLVYEDESAYDRTDDTASFKEMTSRHMAFSQDIGERRLAGHGLRTTTSATTVRTGPGGAKTVHDGPFAETKEQLGGFYLIEAPDLDAAIEIASRVPVYREGSIEIRPLLHQG